MISGKEKENIVNGMKLLSYTEHQASAAAARSHWNAL